MELLLTRKWPSSNSTIGTLQIDGVNECFTLELPLNGGDNAPNTSAILPGRYRILMSNSPHFGRDMPHLQDVPGRTYVMIHWGDYPKDTDGCIIVGRTKGVDFVGVSRDEFDNYLLPKILAALQDGGEVWITIQ